MDQMMLLSVLSAAFAALAIDFGIAGLASAVWVSCAVGAVILARLSYLAAVASAAVFGDLVRSCSGAMAVPPRPFDLPQA
jgi:hypothetical protein